MSEKDEALDDAANRLAEPLSAEAHAANYRALSNMHRANRFRLMFGLPKLPEPHRVQQVLSDECVRCSVASLFGLPREEVPHFFQEGRGSWASPLSNWLREKGLKMEVWHPSLTLPDRYEYYLAYGDATAMPGVGHMVVMRNGEVWHDPSGCGISRFESYITFTPLMSDTTSESNTNSAVELLEKIKSMELQRRELVEDFFATGQVTERTQKARADVYLRLIDDGLSHIQARDAARQLTNIC